MEEVAFRAHPGLFGVFAGIERQGFDNSPTDRFRPKPQYRYTVTLQEILERMNAPTVIDYLSLDVEGTLVSYSAHSWGSVAVVVESLSHTSPIAL